MKKLLILALIFIGFKASAQYYTTPGVPPKTQSFTPTFRVDTNHLITDSLKNIYLSNVNKYYPVLTRPQIKPLFTSALGTNNYGEFYNNTTGTWGFDAHFSWNGTNFGFSAPIFYNATKVYTTSMPRLVLQAGNQLELDSTTLIAAKDSGVTYLKPNFYHFTNGLTDDGSGNITWGGALTGNTAITNGFNSMAFDGNGGFTVAQSSRSSSNIGILHADSLGVAEQYISGGSVQSLSLSSLGFQIESTNLLPAYYSAHPNFTAPNQIPDLYITDSLINAHSPDSTAIANTFQRLFIPNASQYGAAGDNVTDDYPALSAIAATGKDFQLSANKRYKISAAINLSPGQQIYGNGATLVISGTHGINVSDTSAVHDLRIVGSGKATFNVNEIGIYLKKHKGVFIDNVICDSMAYADIYQDSTVNQPGTGNINYKPNVISFAQCYNSKAGFVAGKRGEYTDVYGIRVMGCDTGIVNGGGNNSFFGGDLVYNGINFYLKNAGVNDSHSGAYGLNMTHPTTNYNLIADSITQCYTFSGGVMLVGQISIISSNNVNFLGVTISPRTVSLGIVNTNSSIYMYDCTFQNTTPYTETGSKASHIFSRNILAYNNVTVTPTQRAIDSTRYCTIPLNNKFIIQTTDAALPNALVMASLGTGLVKNTTVTGVQSIATSGTDYVIPSGSITGNAATATTSGLITNITMTDANVIPAAAGAYSYTNASTAANFPVADNGGGILYVRAASSGLTSFMFWKETTATGNNLYVRTGNGASSWTAWRIVATQDYVAGLYAPLLSPSLTTPTLGVATATSINKVTITAPATSATLTIANGKTLTASNTLTLAGTDGTTMTFPSTSSTLMANPMTTLGDVIYGGTSGVATRLAGNTTIARGFLTQTESGGTPAAPSYFDLFGTSNTFVPTQSFTGGLNIGSGSAINYSGAFAGSLNVPTITAGRTWGLPDASGTIALTGQLPIHGNSTTTGSATTAVTVTIGSTMANSTYAVSITPKDLLTAVNYYISAQTTTTFTVTFISALTGSINFDWIVTP